MTKLSKILIAILVLLFVWLFSQKKEFEIQNVIASPAYAFQEQVLNFGGIEENEMVIVQNSAIWGGSSSETPNTALVADKPTRTQFLNTQGYQGGEIEDLIRHYARLYGADENLAVKIAWCESGFDPRVCNKQFGCSGGQGVYQFINSTWIKNCEGDVFNPEDNIKCGVKLISQGQLSHWGSAETWWGSWSCWK